MADEKRKVGAPIGNKNRALEVKAESNIHIRCLTADKARWVKAAQGRGGFSAWVIETLNAAVSKEI